MQKGYLPAIIRQENRHLYQQCLNHAENGDILPLTRLLIGQLAGTLRVAETIRFDTTILIGFRNICFCQQILFF